MTNKEILDEWYKIGKLPSDDDDDYPADKVEELIKQIQLPIDFETTIRLINLSPPIGTGYYGAEWTLVHLIEKYENIDEDFQKIMDYSEEGEIKNMLKKRMENKLNNN